MCFNKNDQLYGGNAWLTQVATDDIIVYKYLIKKKLLFFNKYYAPVINRFSYKKGKTYYSPLNIAIHHHEKIVITSQLRLKKVFIHLFILYMSLDFYPNTVLSLDVILSLVNLLFLKGLHISRMMNR